MRYDAYGETLSGATSHHQPYGYNGKPRDPATGLTDYGFRDYLPQAGRFVTVDPVKDGVNWYAYVNADPVNFVDAWGLAPRNLTEEQRQAYKDAIAEYVDYDVIVDSPSIPAAYDCVDVTAFLYGVAMEASTGEVDAYMNLTNFGGQLVALQEIHSSDFFPEEDQNVDFYEDASFNSPDVEIGTIGVWEADEPTWDGHTATVVDVVRNEDGDVTFIQLLEGRLGGDTSTQTVDLYSQAALDTYAGTFRGWGEIGENPAGKED